MATPYFTQEEREAYREKARHEAEQRIETLARSWQEDPKQLAEYMQFASRFHRYSPRNQMLIYAQNPTASFVASFKAFKDMGYYIRKGEHGMQILAPAPVVFWRKTAVHPWRRLTDATDDEKLQVRIGMYESREQVFYKVGTVFDITQTTCPIEDYPKLLGLGYNDEQHAEIYRALTEYSGTLGMPVTEKPLEMGLRGRFFHADHRIEINSVLGDTQKLSTLLHEMSHGIMEHDTAPDFSVSLKELEADALSIMLEDRFGIEITEARQQHLAEHFTAYMAELAGKDLAFDPTQAFKRVHERYEKCEAAMVQYLEERGILPMQSPVSLTAEPLEPDRAAEQGIAEERYTFYELRFGYLEVPENLRTDQHLDRSRLVGAPLDPMRITQEGFNKQWAQGQREFRDVEFYGSRMPAQMNGRFENCSFYKCDFTATDVSASFKSCAVYEPRTSAAIFKGASFENCKIRHASFCDTVLDGVTFRDTDFQKCNAMKTLFTDVQFNGGSMDRFHFYKDIQAVRVTGLDTMRLGIIGGTEAMSEKHAEQIRDALSPSFAFSVRELDAYAAEQQPTISSEEYTCAVRWMADANRDQLSDTVAELVAGNPPAEDTYKLAAAIVRANDPDLPPELQQAEASGIAYTLLKRHGIPVASPAFNGGKLDLPVQQKLLQRIRSGAGYLQIQVNGVVQPMQGQQQAPVSQTQSISQAPSAAQPIAPPIDPVE